jgi:lipoprotein-releasing system ATP-binding protein
MIKAKNIHKFYGNLEVLKGVDLSIEAGEIISIVGESGAGKSTLLQVLSSLDAPSYQQDYTTEILIDGQDITRMNDKALSLFRNQNIGFVFQFHQLLPEFTALENVIMPRLIANLNPKEAREKAMHICEELNVAHRVNHKPKELSGGEAQRFAVARALINDPKIIFADEPTGNLDSKNAEALHQLFFDLREKYHQTFVIVTHNNTLAEQADRKIIMKDGLIS